MSDTGDRMTGLLVELNNLINEAVAISSEILQCHPNPRPRGPNPQTEHLPSWLFSESGPYGYPPHLIKLQNDIAAFQFVVDVVRSQENALVAKETRSRELHQQFVCDDLGHVWWPVPPSKSTLKSEPKFGCKNCGKTSDIGAA